MANEVLVDGWLGADPDDYPETDDKSHFVKFDIAQRHKGSEQWPQERSIDFDVS